MLHRYLNTSHKHAHGTPAPPQTLAAARHHCGRRRAVPSPPPPPLSSKVVTAAAAAAAQQHPQQQQQRHQNDVRCPDALARQIRDANEAWVADALRHPLIHPGTGARVLLAPVATWAPLQWEVVRGVFDGAGEVRAVGLEAPPLPTSTAKTAAAGDDGKNNSSENNDGDETPLWVAAFLRDFDPLVCEANLSPSLPSTEPPTSALSRLNASLADAAAAAATAGPGGRAPKVGRDVVDGDERFGFYAAEGIARAPTSVLEAWKLLGSWGYLPAMEHVAAAQLAAARGATVACLDAPLALQEARVARAVADFEARRREAAAGVVTGASAAAGALPFELLRSSAELERRAPPAHEEWDAALARAFAPPPPSSVAEGAAAAAQAQAAATLAFKLSRAAAAATLAPDALPGIAARQRRLQPLKWAHFARRDAHLAWRLRELCERFGGGGGGDDGGSSGGGGGAAVWRTAPGRSSSSSSVPDGSPDSNTGGGAVIVAVVGRQHVAPLRALWDDPKSPLWADAPPAAFAPSALDAYAERNAAAAEVAAGGADSSSSGGGAS